VCFLNYLLLWNRIINPPFQFFVNQCFFQTFERLCAKNERQKTKTPPEISRFYLVSWAQIHSTLSVRLLGLFPHYFEHKRNVLRGNLLEEIALDFRAQKTVLQLPWNTNRRRQIFHQMCVCVVGHIYSEEVHGLLFLNRHLTKACSAMLWRHKSSRGNYATQKSPKTPENTFFDAILNVKLQKVCVWSKEQKFESQDESKFGSLQNHYFQIL